jgi:HK97 family phage major capsid protein
MKTLAEQIAAFEAKRASLEARQNEIQTKAIEAGRSKDAAEKEEFDTITADIDTIDSELKDLRAMEKQQLAKAAAVPTAAGAEPGAASAARSGSRGVEVPNGAITVRSNLEKGVPFVRYVKSLVMAKGMPHLAAQIAESNKGWQETSPEVAMVLKAAVAAGDTTTSGWASELVYNQNLTSAFLEYLRPQTIIGKIQGMTKVPFNVRWGTQTGGATGYWVGQGSPTPVSKLTTGSDSLGIAKAAGLVVLDKELMMSSVPAAEVLVRDDLAKTIAQFLDVQFIAPDYAAVANVNPASITNGVDPQAAGGTAAANLRTDAQNLFATFDTNNLEGPDFVWITTPKVARAISLMLTSLGQPLYPTVTPFGGTFLGYPLIVSLSSMQVGSPVTNEGNLLVLVHAPSIAMADEGGLTIDASEEAAIQMLDNPTNASTGGTTATTMVSMFQTNSVALRATRFINWKKRRTFAVQYIKDAAYTS